MIKAKIQRILKITPRALPLFFITCSFLSLAPISFAHCKDTLSKKEREKILKELKPLAKEQNKKAFEYIKNIYKKRNPQITQDTLVPEEDEGKTFDAKLAAEQTDNKDIPPPIDPDLEEAINAIASNQYEELEGTEDFLIPSQIALENPNEILDITLLEDNLVPAEQNLKQCTESGTFIRSVEQNLSVTLIPAKTQEIKICNSHKKDKELTWEKDAKKQRKSWEKKLQEDPTIKTYKVSISKGGLFRKYTVKKKWTHKNDTPCSDFSIQTNTLVEQQQSDTWETDPSQIRILKTFEDNPQCTINQVLNFQAGSRIISGQPVYKEAWNRRIIFSCTAEEDSKCKRLRDKGGILHQKTCIEKDDLGSCLHWNKTYDMGGRAAYQTKVITTPEGTLYDSREFETSYEKNQSFPQVASTLASLDNIASDLPKTPFNAETVRIFSGKKARCRRSIEAKNIFDCCAHQDCEGRGILIALGLGSCDKEEKDLFENKSLGKCHYVGAIKNAVFPTEHVYCCFPTLISRIIQEAGHDQLGITWGKSEKPRCKGLSLEQIQSIDFSEIDFSDFTETLREKISPEEIQEKFQTSMKNFSPKAQRAQLNTEGKLQIPRQQIQPPNPGDRK